MNRSTYKKSMARILEIACRADCWDAPPHTFTEKAVRRIKEVAAEALGKPSHHDMNVILGPDRGTKSMEEI